MLVSDPCARTFSHTMSCYTMLLPSLKNTKYTYITFKSHFWATVSFCKTVRPILSDRCPVLSVCNFGVVWPNGWMDQDETWHSGRHRPHCVRWGPSFPSKGHSPQFSAHFHCGQMAGWIKMPLRMEVGLGPGDCVTRGPSSPKRAQPPNFWPMSVVAKWLDVLRCHLVRR